MATKIFTQTSFSNVYSSQSLLMHAEPLSTITNIFLGSFSGNKDQIMAHHTTFIEGSRCTCRQLSFLLSILHR